MAVAVAQVMLLVNLQQRLEARFWCCYWLFRALCVFELAAWALGSGCNQKMAVMVVKLVAAGARAGQELGQMLAFLLGILVVAVALEVVVVGT